VKTSALHGKNGDVWSLLSGNGQDRLGIAPTESPTQNQVANMNTEALRELLTHAPFEPFELITTAGERHVVKHPEFCILLPSRIVVTDPAADRVSIVSLIHLTEARMLSPAGRNGA
jgi:hypothetical protein